MIRTVALGLLGLLAAVAVGIGIHLVTRDTIALPVVRLEQGATLAPRAATTATQPAQSSTGATSTAGTPTAPGTSAATTDDDDNSGRGRGRNRGRGGDDD